MKLSRLLEDLITTTNISNCTNVGTLLPHGNYAIPTMVKRKYKRNNAVKKKKHFIGMQMRPLPTQK